MQKIIYAAFGCICLFGLVSVGCTDKRPEPVSDSTMVDSASTDTSKVDSVDSVIIATPMPKAADALFDDFFFNFAANPSLQRERIIFPLKMRNGETVTEKQKSEWKTDKFFMHQGYYTLIFDSKKQLEIHNDTSIKRATVEKIYLRKKTIEQYRFEKIRGAWMLREIETIALNKSSNASFLSFYQKFATDEQFQTRSLNEPVKMTVPDPDDDFQMMTGDIYPDQWIDYRPQIMPHDFIYNINYGQKPVSGTSKIFVIRGIANGLEERLFFKQVSGKWKLMEFVN